jgi:vacuolar-type H+-ATPase subunit H
MERVWQELKRIEAQANQIRDEADTRAKEITNTAKQEAEELIANSKAYAEQEGQRLQKEASREANEKREARLRANEESLKEMESDAQKKIPQAQKIIVDAVLGKTID